MTLRIRQATGADSTLLSELGYRIYPAHFQHLWVSDAEMTAFLDAEYTPSVIEQNAGAYRFYQKQGMLCIKNVLFETASQQSILKIMGMSL
ncbi:hypothetical protein L8P41_00180 [Enterobacter roggenkampii]|uniref:hypothetical protein n=1 Tax=Enterobacter roggenkampii TaxID=1812935 RepID=UPI002002D7EA|nr:hypothetical protein [Enterobacter roggenkampii]MCK7069249.1 hypothetical protein [Enterobacter roggenkampii]MCK7091519.1 hypothetical protein [Enterobacter roggenkampii]